MDPLNVYYLGQIRQQEFIEQAEAWRSSELIWERLYRWVAPRIAARRNKARYASTESLDACATVPTIADNC